MDDPELNEAIQSAFDKQATATASKAAVIIEAEGKKAAAILTAQGEAEGITLKAKAEAQRPAEMIKVYTQNGLTGPEATRVATSLVIAELNANAIAQHKGAYAPGSGMQIALLEKDNDGNQEQTPQVVATDADWQQPAPPVRPQGNRNTRQTGNRGGKRK